MLPTEIADLLLSPEGYSFNTSPEKKKKKKDLLPHHSVILTTRKHMHKNLVVLNKATNARAVRECNKKRDRGKKLLVSSLTTMQGWVREDSLPLSRECEVQLVTLTLPLPVCAERGHSSWTVYLVSILKEPCSQSWKGFRIWLTE